MPGAPFVFYKQQEKGGDLLRDDKKIKVIKRRFIL